MIVKTMDKPSDQNYVPLPMTELKHRQVYLHNENIKLCEKMPSNNITRDQCKNEGKEDSTMSIKSSLVHAQACHSVWYDNAGDDIESKWGWVDWNNGSEEKGSGSFNLPVVKSEKSPSGSFIKRGVIVPSIKREEEKFECLWQHFTCYTSEVKGVNKPEKMRLSDSKTYNENEENTGNRQEPIQEHSSLGPKKDRAISDTLTEIPLESQSHYRKKKSDEDFALQTWHQSCSANGDSCSTFSHQIPDVSTVPAEISHNSDAQENMHSMHSLDSLMSFVLPEQASNFNHGAVQTSHGDEKRGLTLHSDGNIGLEGCMKYTTATVNLANNTHILHKNQKNLHCPLCKYTSRFKGNLVRHIETVHKNRKHHCCPHCDYKGGLKETLTRHIQTVHEGRKDHRCPHCDYKTGQKVNLIQHVKTVHEGRKDQCCSRCDYKTGYKGHLTRHINVVHENRRDHSCPLCDYKAGQRGKLVKHIETVHQGRKNHSCGYCEFMTGHKGTLVRHATTVHEGQKDHCCSHCNYDAGH